MVIFAIALILMVIMYITQIPDYIDPSASEIDEFSITFVPLFLVLALLYYLPNLNDDFVNSLFLRYIEEKQGLTFQSESEIHKRVELIKHYLVNNKSEFDNKDRLILLSYLLPEEEFAKFEDLRKDNRIVNHPLYEWIGRIIIVIYVSQFFFFSLFVIGFYHLFELSDPFLNGILTSFVVLSAIFIPLLIYELFFRDSKFTETWILFLRSKGYSFPETDDSEGISSDIVLQVIKNYFQQQVDLTIDWFFQDDQVMDTSIENPK